MTTSFVPKISAWTFRVVNTAAGGANPAPGESEGPGSGAPSPRPGASSGGWPYHTFTFWSRIELTLRSSAGWNDALIT